MPLGTVLGFSFLISQQNDSYAMRLLPLFLLATGASATCQRDPRGGGNLGRSKNFLPVIVKNLKDLNSRTLGTVVGSAVGGPAGGSVGNVVGGTVAVVRQDKLLW